MWSSARNRTWFFFLTYINNMKNSFSTGKVISYTDDRTFCFTGSNWVDVLIKTQIGLNDMKTWLDINLLH